MNNQQVVGLVLLVTGVLLFGVGMNASHSLADRWNDFFTGHFTDSTMGYMLGGIASGVVGALLLGSRKAAA